MGNALVAIALALPMIILTAIYLTLAMNVKPLEKHHDRSQASHSAHSAIIVR